MTQWKTILKSYIGSYSHEVDEVLHKALKLTKKDALTNLVLAMSRAKFKRTAYQFERIIIRII